MSPGLMRGPRNHVSGGVQTHRYRTARSPPSMSPGVREGAQGTMCQVGVRTPKGQDDHEPAFDEPRAHEGSKESCVRWSPDPQV